MSRSKSRFLLFLLDVSDDTAKMYLNNIVNELDFFDTEVLLTLGAGDIDTIVEPLKQALINYFKN